MYARSSGHLKRPREKRSCKAINDTGLVDAIWGVCYVEGDYAAQLGAEVAEYSSSLQILSSVGLSLESRKREEEPLSRVVPIRCMSFYWKEPEKSTSAPLERVTWP